MDEKVSFNMHEANKEEGEISDEDDDLNAIRRAPISSQNIIVGDNENLNQSWTEAYEYDHPNLSSSMRAKSQSLKRDLPIPIRVNRIPITDSTTTTTSTTSTSTNNTSCGDVSHKSKSHQQNQYLNDQHKPIPLMDIKIDLSRRCMEPPFLSATSNTYCDSDSSSPDTRDEINDDLRIDNVNIPAGADSQKDLYTDFSCGGNNFSNFSDKLISQLVNYNDEKVSTNVTFVDATIPHQIHSCIPPLYSLPHTQVLPTVSDIRRLERVKQKKNPRKHRRQGESFYEGMYCDKDVSHSPALKSIDEADYSELLKDYQKIKQELADLEMQEAATTELLASEKRKSTRFKVDLKNERWLKNSELALIGVASDASAQGTISSPSHSKHDDDDDDDDNDDDDNEDLNALRLKALASTAQPQNCRPFTGKSTPRNAPASQQTSKR